MRQTGLKFLSKPPRRRKDRKEPQHQVQTLLRNEMTKGGNMDTIGMSMSSKCEPFHEGRQKEPPGPR